MYVRVVVMGKKTGYVRSYNSKKGYGFCLVHGLENKDGYTSVFFHISDVKGLKGVTKSHLLRGNVKKGPKGWKMTNIKAEFKPNSRIPFSNKNRIQKRKKRERTSKQSKRLPPSVRAKRNERDDTPISSHMPKKMKKKKGGRWRGDKYIPK